MKYFGAPDARYPIVVPTPIGRKCDYFRCKYFIEEGDEGFIMPLLNADGSVGEVVQHRFCMVFAVGLHTTHTDDEPCNCDETFERLFLIERERYKKAAHP